MSVFAGDEDCPRDVKSAERWEELGIPKERIFYLPKKNNWWIAGTTGPCGPDTEIFIVTDKEPCSPECSPACDCGRYVEIWNNVFMQYYKHSDGTYTPLEQKNVDTGMGLERTLAMLNGYKSVYETDVLRPVVEFVTASCGKTPEGETLKAIRIIADHIRTATFMLGDEFGIVPSNVDRGYILRRLIRRAVRYARLIELAPAALTECAAKYVEIYAEAYPELRTNREKIMTELDKEIGKFDVTLQQGLKEFDKLLKYIQDKRMSGKAAFRLYDTYGFPIEMTLELARDNGITVDVEGYERAYNEHQQKSKAGAEQKFKGGLADSSEATTNLHTATHILLAALRKVTGDETVMQKGSNITPERLRVDFNFPRPLTPEEIKAVEAEVNGVIEAGIDVVSEEMSVEAARAAGAIGVFGDRYGETVKVYTIGDYSKEICGGPHAKNTRELGKFVITKEQSSSAGVRRIKAELKK